MYYQLDKTLVEAKLGSEKVTEIYNLLESHLRGSIMSSELNNRYPELTLGKDDYRSIPIARNSRSYMIAKEGHPFDKMTYTEYSQGMCQTTYTYKSTYGAFHDPDERVLKYVRPELFKN